jgi:cyclopropane fatty-acyl-phospholipid synthase-like methyltransferase
MNKSFIDTQEQWNRVAQGGNWRGYLAQGYELEPNFRDSGFNWTMQLNSFLYKFGISLHNKIILELGCGAGRMSEFLAQEVKKLYAVDISVEIIALARERLEKTTNVDLICILEEGESFSILENSSIDLVFSVAVLQHCSENIVKDYFKDIGRILKSNGYFVFQIPIAEKHETIPYEQQPAVDMTYWTLDEIKQLAKDEGYYIINIPKDTRSNGKEYFIFKKENI